MLILFHLLQLFVWNLMNKRKHNTVTDRPQTESQEISCNFQQDDEVQLKFDPPVYRQRYGKVYEILLNDKWRKEMKKIVDFGCAEFGLFTFLKNLTSVREMLFIDIDEELLLQHVFRLQPLMYEHLIRRKFPLELNVYLGSVALPDEVLTGCDAVIAIELIEHLYPDTLDAFPYNIFAYVQPKLVIISTPNADFNVLFKKMGKFRHYDHKFEWSREQFEDWASNCVRRFPNYSVEFFGCGDPPADSANIGFCSQGALFTRTDKNCDLSETDLNSHGVCTYMSRTPSEFTNFKEFSFKHLRRIEYPYDTDERTDEERVLDQIKYRMSMFGTFRSRFYDEAKERCEIPLEDIMYDLHIDINELKRILQNSGYTVAECRLEAIDEWKLCIIHVPEETMDSSEMSECDSEPIYENVNEGELSDWDNEVCAPQKQVDDEKKPDPLVDSGYQKSSIVDDSPQSPSAEEMDSFDESPKNVKKFPDTNTVNELQNVPNKPFKVRKKEVKDALPGPSNVVRKGIGPKKASTPSDSEEEGYWEDVRSIANCLLENTLNKIDVNAEEPMELIEQNAEVEEAGELVENGDLANNNRDLEGNNYVADDEQVDVVEDEVNDNLEVDEGVVLVEENNNEDNRVEEEIVEEPHLIEQPAEVVALASREALFDPNSEQDLHIDEEFSSECVVVGVRMGRPENSEAQTFPSWLLQILGGSEGEGHDEPHFYCQGDGLGVHPSIVVDVDDDSSSSNTSSRHTDVEEAQQDATESEFSLPEDSRQGEELENGQADILVQTEEFFDALPDVDANQEE